jgi:WD40 repeat protein
VGDSLPLILGALRLSAHIVSRDPRQFASQLRGRLLPYQSDPPIGKFLRLITEAAPRPWLCPLHAGLTPPGGALIRTLAGHANIVSAVALSADGKRAVSASWDKMVKVWNVDTGRETCSLSGHSALVSAVAVSVDGRCAVSASNDGTLKVWDLYVGNARRTLAGHANIVSAVALSADRKRAVVRTIWIPCCPAYLGLADH